MKVGGEVGGVVWKVRKMVVKGWELILEGSFERIGLNGIEEEVLGKVVKGGLGYGRRKGGRVEYLKKEFEEDVEV